MSSCGHGKLNYWFCVPLFPDCSPSNGVVCDWYYRYSAVVVPSRTVSYAATEHFKAMFLSGTNRRIQKITGIIQHHSAYVCLCLASVCPWKPLETSSIMLSCCFTPSFLACNKRLPSLPLDSHNLFCPFSPSPGGFSE